MQATFTFTADEICVYKYLSKIKSSYPPLTSNSRKPIVVCYVCNKSKSISATKDTKQTIFYHLGYISHKKKFRNYMFSQ